MYCYNLNIRKYNFYNDDIMRLKAHSEYPKIRKPI